MSGHRGSVVITAGGTGGHVFPALAVAEELQTRGFLVHWIGTKKGLEAVLVPQHQIPISYIHVQGLRGHGWRRLFSAPLMVYQATRQCIKILQKQRALCVLGMGGYVTGPVGLAAWISRLPLVIHEQNAVAGTTNKILAKFARQVLQAFPGTFNEKDKVTVSGNPIRKEITALPAPEQRFAPRRGGCRILVLGGSLGASILNEWVPEALARLPDTIELDVCHQCGEVHLENTTALYTSLRLKNWRVEKFIENMAEALGWADLVIARAGALTVSELATAGVGSLLIPYPYAIDNHQARNAQYLADRGAAIVCLQKELSSEILSTKLLELLQQGRQQWLQMAMNARTLAQPNATKEVADHCERWVNHG